MTRAVNTAAVGIGGVIQVVQGTTTSYLLVSGNTYTDTTLSAQITPTSATSRILVMVSQLINPGRSGASAGGGGVRILRDSTVIFVPGQDAGPSPFDFYLSAAGTTSISLYLRACINFVDSPATTATVTYKTQAAAYAGSTIGLQGSGGVNNGTSVITLLEIAG